MADYHSLIARAVAGLEKNSGESRRALYERARTALVAQLRGVVPALDEAEITRERLALEEAIRKVEAEAARQARFESRPVSVAARPPRPPATPPASDVSAPSRTELSPGTGESPAPAPEGGRSGDAAVPQDSLYPDVARPESVQRESAYPDASLRRERPSIPVDLDAAAASQRREPRVEMPPRSSVVRGRPPGDRGPDAAHAARGAAPDVVRGRGARPAPPAAHDFDQLESRDPTPLDPEAVEALRQTRVGLEPSPSWADSRPVMPRPRSPQGEPVEEAAPELKTARSLRGFVIPILSILIVLALCAAAVWYRSTLVGIYQAFMTPSATAPAQSDATTTTPSSRPKISDRIGAPQDASRSGPAVAQRVVLYEEEPNDPQGKRYVGSVLWKTETVSPGAGQPPELAIKAEVEIPERKMTMTWSLRRNTDKTLPASHTIEIMFNLPPDFTPGGINNVPGILMKQAEQTRGTPLAGLAVKVTNNFFLIGLSAVEADLQRNLQLLKERAWFDIPVVYNNNRRAILALEKGTPGERAFDDVFAAWKQ